MMERGLVTATPIETSPLFSENQKRVLGRSALNYLKDGGFGVTTQSLQLASQVVLDALNRGLLIEGRIALDPKEAIKKYLDSGFRQREERRKVASDIANSDYWSSSQDRHVGVFALQASLVDRARQKLNSFALEPDITDFDELVLIVEKRKQTLDGLFEFSISNLPENLQNNARVRVKTADEKAKLVRNSMLAFATREDFNPIVAMESLAEFLQSFKENPQSLSPMILEKLKVFLEVNSYLVDDDKENFINDLFSQVNESFEYNKSRNIGTRDELYLVFSRQFLLLHPALEEARIITDIGNINLDRPSLWDSGNSVEIEGYKIPQREILMAANRQAKASGNKLTQERLERGIRFWRSYERHKSLLPGKVGKLRDILSGLQIEIKELQESYGEGEPRPALIATKELKEVNGSLSKMRTTFNLNKRIIREDFRQRDSSAKLYQKALDEGVGFDLPREVRLDLLKKKADGLSHSSYALGVRRNELSSLIRGITSESFLRFVTNEISTVVNEWENNVEDFVGRMNFLLISLKGQRGSSVFAQDTDLEFIYNQIHAELSISKWTNYRRKLVGQTGDTRLTRRLRKVDSEIKDGKVKIDDPRVLNLISVATITRLRNLAQNFIATGKSIAEVDLRQNYLRQTYRDLIEDSTKKIPDDALINFSVDDLGQQALETSISTLPKINPTVLESARTLKAIDFDNIRFLLPKKVSRVEFEEVLIRQIQSEEQSLAELAASLESVIPEELSDSGKAEYQRSKMLYDRRSKRLESTKVFFEMLDDPFVEIARSEGMSTREYVELMKKRRDRAVRYLSLRDYSMEIPQLQEKLRVAQTESSLRDKIDLHATLTRELNELMFSNRVDLRFARNMEEQGLALKVR